MTYAREMAELCCTGLAARTRIEAFFRTVIERCAQEAERDEGPLAHPKLTASRAAAARIRALATEDMP